jgi:hypothetical protein
LTRVFADLLSNLNRIARSAMPRKQPNIAADGDQADTQVGVAAFKNWAGLGVCPN